MFNGQSRHNGGKYSAFLGTRYGILDFNLLMDIEVYEWLQVCIVNSYQQVYVMASSLLS